MKQILPLSFLFLLILFSCGQDPKHEEKFISSGFDYVESELIRRSKEKQDSIDLHFNLAHSKVNDSILDKELSVFYKQLGDYFQFIDSLKKMTVTKPETKANDEKLVNTIFISGGSADSMFSKIKTIVAQIEKITLSKNTREDVNRRAHHLLYEIPIEKQKTIWFGTNDVWSAHAALFGFEDEVGTLGITVLKEYSKSP